MSTLVNYCKHYAANGYVSTFAVNYKDINKLLPNGSRFFSSKNFEGQFRLIEQISNLLKNLSGKLILFNP